MNLDEYTFENDDINDGFEYESGYMEDRDFIHDTANSEAAENIGEIPLSNAEYAKITSMTSDEIDDHVRVYIAVFQEADDQRVRDEAFAEIQKYMQALIKKEISKIVKTLGKTQDGHLYKRMFNFGLIGLMRAINRFDLSYNENQPNRRAKFSSYAYTEIIKMLRKASTEELSPPSLGINEENKIKVKTAMQNFIKTVGREPDIVDLYYELRCEIEMEKIKDCLNVIQAGNATEIDPDKEYEGLYGFQESVEDEVEKNQQREYVNDLLDSLSEADPNGVMMAAVIRMSFGLEGADAHYDENYEGIGAALGITKDTAKKFRERGMMLLQELAGVQTGSREVSIPDHGAVKEMASRLDDPDAVQMTPDEYLKSRKTAGGE